MPTGSVNVTSSVSKDETSLIEEELTSNQTSVFVKEDDGEFTLILHQRGNPSLSAFPELSNYTDAKHR